MLTALGTLMHAEWYVTPDARATAVRARHAMWSDTSSFNHITVERMQELLPNKGCPRRYAMDTANLHFNIGTTHTTSRKAAKGSVATNRQHAQSAAAAASKHQQVK